jgi:competence protein ComEC
LAISGLHVTQILWLFHLFLFLFPIPERGRRGILLLSLPLLYFLTGGSVSVFRALVMTAFPLLGGLLRRRSDSVTALIFAGSVLCACDPACVTDPSFLLSFFSTFSILTAAVPFCLWFREEFFKGKGILSGCCFWLISSFTISVFSFVFLFPLQILLFSEGNLLSPLFALILIPLFAPCLLAGLVSSFLVLLPGSFSWVLSLLCRVPQWFLSLVFALSKAAPPLAEADSSAVAFSFLLLLVFSVLSRARIRSLFLLYIGAFLCCLLSLFL